MNCTSHIFRLPIITFRYATINSIIKCQYAPFFIIEQLSILYNAKMSLTNRLPDLADQATFKNLKMALQEDLDDTHRQMTGCSKR